MRYLISGGGTGGHIFPAVSIANALKDLDPEAKILFVGALGRMEMERCAAGRVRDRRTTRKRVQPFPTLEERIGAHRPR